MFLLKSQMVLKCDQEEESGCCRKSNLFVITDTKNKYIKSLFLIQYENLKKKNKKKTLPCFLGIS